MTLELTSLLSIWLGLCRFIHTCLYLCIQSYYRAIYKRKLVIQFLKDFTYILKVNSPLLFIYSAYCAYQIDHSRLFKYCTLNVYLTTQVFDCYNYSYWISTWYHLNSMPVVGNICVKRIRIISLSSNFCQPSIDYTV